MTKIEPSKLYSLNNGTKFFKVFTSADTEGNFHGAIVHYELFDGGKNTEVDIKKEVFVEASEEVLFKTIEDWVSENFPGPFEESKNS